MNSRSSTNGKELRNCARSLSLNPLCVPPASVWNACLSAGSLPLFDCGATGRTLGTGVQSGLGYGRVIVGIRNRLRRQAVPGMASVGSGRPGRPWTGTLNRIAGQWTVLAV